MNAYTPDGREEACVGAVASDPAPRPITQAALEAHATAVAASSRCLCAPTLEDAPRLVRSRLADMFRDWTDFEMNEALAFPVLDRDDRLFNRQCGLEIARRSALADLARRYGYRAVSDAAMDNYTTTKEQTR